MPGGRPDAEAMLIIEIEEQHNRTRRLARPAARDLHRAARPDQLARLPVRRGSAAIWKNRKGAFGAIGRISPDGGKNLCMDGVIPTSRLPDVLRRIGEMSDECGLKVTPAEVRRRQHHH